MPPVSLDSLSKVDFERIANHLLWAELSGKGHYWPNPTPEGRTDGGFDGAFTGVYAGRDRRWRVSAKHTLAADPVDGLENLLRDELARYPDSSWLIATNARLDPAKQLRLDNWLRNQPIEDAAVADGNTMRLLSERHAYVLRVLGFGSSGGEVLVRPPDRIALPDSWSAVVERVMAATAEPGIVALQAPSGMGLELVLREVAYQVTARDRARYPLWIELLDQAQLAALDQALHDLPDESRYVFLAPPGAQADAIAARAGRLRGTRDRVVVVGLGAHQRSPVGARVIELAAPPNADVREWLQKVARGSLEFRSRVFNLSGGRPGDAFEFVTRGFLAIQERVETVLADQRAAGLDDLRARELLALLVLALPLQDDAEPVRWIAEVSGVSVQDAQRVLHAARHLVTRGAATTRDASRLQSAAILGCCSLTPQRRALLVDRPELAVRLAALGDDENPLLAVLDRDLIAVESGDYVSTNTALVRAAAVGGLSTEIAARVLAIGRAAARRSSSVNPFGQEADEVPALRDVGNRHLVHASVDALVACAFQSTVLSEAIVEILDLLRADPRRNVKEIVKAFFHPRHPDATHAAIAFATIKSELDRHLDTTVSEIAVEGADLWLRCTVESTGSFGDSFSWGEDQWKETSPNVQNRRTDAIAILNQLIVAPSASARRRGWRAWRAVWGGRTYGNTPPMPPVLASTVRATLAKTPATLVSDDWGGAGRCRAVRHRVGDRSGDRPCDHRSGHEGLCHGAGVSGVSDPRRS